jgi:hypothetical protein
MEQLSRQLRTLRVFVGMLTILVIGCIVALVFVTRRNNNPDELTVRRINIVEPDGRLALVISDHANQHPGAMDGKDLPSRDRPAGMIFFNELGDECGGLVYDGTKKEASMVWSVDQFRNDQIMQLQYLQDSDTRLTRSYGLKLWDRSDLFPLGAQIEYFDSLHRQSDTAAVARGVDELRKRGLMPVERLFLGRTRDGLTGLFLRDDKGVPRLRIYVDKQNVPLIETLDEKGVVVSSGHPGK